ncbi:O-antigen ligase family protein [Fretibacter rubidus]|uniref:O-antigen ligase family protein n=1 Tax=Fretibacter rubidus TaxID=570162 RepID=UPI00352A8DBA
MTSWRLTAYLMLCVILGGTAQSIMSYKAPLYLLSVIFLGWILIDRDRHSLRELICPPLLFLALLPFLFILYLIPLPAWLWSELASKSYVIEGYRLTGQDLPALPLSIAPEKTMYGLFAFLPILTTALIARLSRTPKELKRALLSVPIIAVAVAFLGVLQTFLGDGYLVLYEAYTLNRPVGIFSNTNHLGTFLAVALSFAAVSIFQHPRKQTDRDRAKQKALSIVLIILMICVGLLTGSSAAYLLIILSASLSLLWFSRGTYGKGAIFICWGLGAFIFAIDFFVLSREFTTLLSKFSVETSISRVRIFETTWEAIKEGGLFGYGPGSFSEVYKIYEREDEIITRFANETHNEYLQLCFEFGIFGFLWLCGLIVWLCSQAWRLLRTSRRKSLTQKACLIGLTIIGIHSFVDYPLRTISMATIATLLAVVLVNHGRQRSSSA